MMAKHMRCRGQTGYILIYVLAVMMLLAGLALSVAHRQRIGVQLVHNIADMTRQELALNAAVTYAKAELDLARQLSDASKTNDMYAGIVDIWRVGDQRMLRVGDTQVAVTLKPGIAAPDFNMFTDQEIARLFVAMGVSADVATEYAQRILGQKPNEGFASVENLLSISGIPTELLGRSGTAGNDKSEKTPVDLYHLVQVGSRVKQIDLNVTPLPVIAALTGLSMDQLAPLLTMRAAGPVAKDAAVAKIGGSLASLVAPADAILVNVSVVDGSAWSEVLLLGSKGGMDNDPIKVQYGIPNNGVSADKITANESKT